MNKRKFEDSFKPPTDVQIIFQNGEFLEDQSTFLGISLDTIFTVLTTIIIFIGGYIANRKIELNKEKKRLVELEDYFKNLIELLEKPLTVQKNGLLKFSKILKEEKEQHFFLDDVSNFQVDQIKEIDNKDLYTIYIKNKKGDIAIKTELFRKLRGSIDHIDALKKHIKPDFENLLKKYEQFEMRYRENIKLTSELFENMVSQNIQKGIPPKDDPFLAHLDQIRAKWSGMESQGINYKDMYVARKYYLESLQNLCRKYANDPRCIFYLKPLMESIYAFNDIKEGKYVYRRAFLLQAKDIQNSFFEIKKSIKAFNEMRII